MSGDADAIQRRYSASFWRYTDAMMLLRVYGEQETLLLVYRKSSWWLDAWEGQK